MFLYTLVMLPKSFLIAAWLILPAIISACKQGKSGQTPSETVVALANGNDIRGDRFLKEYNAFKKRTKIPELEDKKLENRLREGIINHMIDSMLLYEEAKKSGIIVSPKMRDETAAQLTKGVSPARLGMILKQEEQTYDEWKEGLLKNMVIEELVRAKIAPMVEVPEEEIKDYYQRQLDKFKIPARIHAFHIVLPSLSEADEIRNELLSRSDFSELARKYSKSPDADDGGDLGIFARGHMPKEFDDVLFKLKISEISKVVESPYGFHIFKVVEKFKPRKMKYAEAREKIFDEMFNEQLERKFAQWMLEIREKAKVVIYYDRLYRL